MKSWLRAEKHGLWLSIWKNSHISDFSEFRKAMLKTNVHISHSCLTHTSVCVYIPCYNNRLIGYFAAFCGFTEQGSLYKAIYRMTAGISGGDRTTFRYVMPIQLPQGVSQFHDSKITPTSKYQTTAVGRRQKELYSHTTYIEVRVHSLTHSCCKNKSFSMICQHVLFCQEETIYLAVDKYSNLPFTSKRVAPRFSLNHSRKLTQWCCGTVYREYAKQPSWIKVML